MEYDQRIANEHKWSQRAATYDQKRFDYFRMMQRELITASKIPSPPTFLDLGCGTGWAVCYVAKQFEGNGRFVGVDLANGMIERAKSNAEGIANTEFYQARADDLPFEEGSFETVICSNSFHHYPDPVKALQEVRRVLRQNGRIHILDVTADDLFIRWIDSSVRTREKEHVRFYSTQEYIDLFAQSGLLHIRSSQVKIWYPLKIHIAEKENAHES